MRMNFDQKLCWITCLAFALIIILVESQTGKLSGWQPFIAAALVILAMRKDRGDL